MTLYECITGNLYVKLVVSDHPTFKRRGSDVHTDVKISVAQAVLGCSLSIPSLKGEVEVQVGVRGGQFRHSLITLW
jgi:molecular chaperone DnaJ